MDHFTIVRLWLRHVFEVHEAERVQPDMPVERAPLVATLFSKVADQDLRGGEQR
jgi:hypothetical protein